MANLQVTRAVCRLPQLTFVIRAVELKIMDFTSFYKTSSYTHSRGRGTGGGGGNGHVPPPPKVKKVPFFLGLNAPFKERKKYFLNKRSLFLERKCHFCSSKETVKAISDVIETPYFQKMFVRRVNVIKSFDFGHIQKCPFWSMPLHF